MKVEKRDGSREKLITTAMITNDLVLSRIATKWDKEGMLHSPWANLVGGWCVEYHKRYGKAPRKAIVGLFQSWAEDHDDKELVKSIESLLGGLSGSYIRAGKEINPDYVVDLAGQHFNRVKLRRLVDTLEGDLDSGKVEEGYKRLGSFDKVELGEGQIIDVLQDEEAVDRSFAQQAESLIRFKGDIGKFFGRTLCRDAFVAFLGPEKRGKTYWLIEIAWQAILQRRKVLFFEIGDLSEAQMMMRLQTRAAMMPEQACEVEYPVKFEKDDNDHWQLTTKKKVYKKGLSAQKAKEAFKRVMMEQVRSKDPYLKLSVHAMNTVGMGTIKSTVQRLQRQNWVPDLIVIDYADLLLPAPGYSESRDAINANWKAMRGLSQEGHCLVLTATQANAASYSTEALEMGNFSEDKRKNAHCTGMIGLNQSDDEKEQGVMRLGWLARRSERFHPKHFCYVAGCPELSTMAVTSRY
jgi:hypothetical protein